jgi:2'-5' RNA ligase
VADFVNTAQQIYDNLWSEGSQALERGQPELDPFLLNRKSDLRRCVTLALRPNGAVKERISSFLREAEHASPHQHFYQPDELHVTVLALIPSSTSWREQLHELPVIRDVLSRLLARRNSFTISFRGVSVSRHAVLIQGFPTDDSLTRLRDELRSELKRNNIGANIDRRYRISAAHITVMRFKTPGGDWGRLLELLKANRTTHFGDTRVTAMELIFGDFYASAERIRTLAKYYLR